MQKIQVYLNTVEKIRDFVDTITRFPYDFDLVSGRYVIDAKSIMGIFSLDLRNPLELNVYAPDEEIPAIRDLLTPYISE